MAYDEDIVKQLGNPSGHDGEIILAHLNKVNANMNNLTKSVLCPQPDDHLLEIGFGSGALNAQIIKETFGIRVIEIDISTLAMDVAK